jgi:hypothetical protein
MASATASTMGSIMAVVAVFEIHIDRNIVVNMKPSIRRAWLVPTCTRYTLIVSYISAFCEVHTRYL